MSTPYSVTIEDDATYSEFEGSVVDGVAITYGEINTASNVGVGGVGVFDAKSGVDLQFKNINAGSAKITITDDTANNEIDIDAALALDDLTDVSAAAPTTGQALVWDGSAWAADTLSPLTTKGDLYAFTSVDARLAVGTDGYFLKAASAQTTGLVWAAIGAADVAAGTFGAGNFEMDGTLTIDGAADAVQLKIQANATQTNNLIEAQTSAGVAKLVVTKDGYLGINVATAPTLPLEVVSGADAAGDGTIQLFTDTANGRWIRISRSGVTSTIASYRAELVLSAWNNVAINAVRVRNTAIANSLYFTVEGDMGVGITTPTAHAHIAGTSDVVQLKVQANSTQTNYVQTWTTSTGTVEAYIAPGGHAKFADLEVDGALNHDGSTVGFYGTAPIAQQVLATGAGATADNIISALQALGLVKQA